MRALMGVRSVDLEPFDIEFASSSFRPIGIATTIPDFGIHSQRTFIWHAPTGFLPITRSELIRFEMDAPDGSHLIFSERKILPECEPLDSSKLQIVTPEQISHWIGRAVLSGDLVASAIEDYSSDEELDRFVSTSKDQGTNVLCSLIDIASWTTNRGIEGFSSSPLLLEARIWQVSGDLQGPKGSSESGEWTILEDPWSQRLSIIGDSENMKSAPILRSVSPPKENWLGEDRLKQEISKIVEERRRGESGEMSISGKVRSMLLEKWILDIPRALIENSKVMIPGWLISLDSDKILHGRNGRLYDLVPLK